MTIRMDENFANHISDKGLVSKIYKEPSEHNNFFLNFIYLFIFGCFGSSLLCEGFSLVAARWGYSSLQCMGFSLRWLLLLQSTGPRRMGFSSCGTRAQ